MRKIVFDHNKDDFWNVLQERVQGYFKTRGISPYATGSMWVKISILLLSFIVPYLLILFWDIPLISKWMLCFILGLSMAGIGLAVSHQAVHQAISSKKNVNRLLGLSFNLLGMSDYIWKIKHNVFHHTYTNVFELDEALKEGDLIRMSADAPYKAMHRYQHVYTAFVYGIFTIVWAFFLDFEKLFRYNRNGSLNNRKKHSVGEYILFFTTKIYYIVIAFVLPYYVADLSISSILIGFVSMHIPASLIVTHVLQVEHLVPETTHVTPNEAGIIERSWAVNQLEGTSNFTARTAFFSWYLGGSNYQIEHHLFPKICAIHYPEISKIIEDTAHEYGFNYHRFESFGAALKAHYRFLKVLGEEPKIELV